MKVEEPIVAYEQLSEDKLYTYFDYLKWQFKERVELIKGRIFKMSPAPATVHQKIIFSISGLLYNIFKKNKCKVFIAPFDVRLNVKNEVKDTTVVQPDICIICDESKIDEKGCNGSPDIIIEIVSPNSLKHDTETKFNIYEQSGVNEYWIVFPETKTILVYVLKDEKYTGLPPFVIGQTIISYTIPNIEINLDEVFEN
ncbi:MAG: Uma2 family endonuclease [Bacteroidia bacterium]